MIRDLQRELDKARLNAGDLKNAIKELTENNRHLEKVVRDILDSGVDQQSDELKNLREENFGLRNEIEKLKDEQ